MVVWRRAAPKGEDCSAPKEQPSTRGKHASRAKGIPISSSRAKSRDLYSRTINDEYEKAEKRRNKTSVFFGALLRMTAVQWRFLDCARNDDTGKLLSKHAGIFVIGISLLVSWSPHSTFPPPRTVPICYNKYKKALTLLRKNNNTPDHRTLSKEERPWTKFSIAVPAGTSKN